MKGYYKKLTLDTSYERTGNSSGMEIDTLAIALTGDDYNDLLDYNIDYTMMCESEGEKYAIDQHAESLFRDTLTKEQLTAYTDDLQGYNDALQEYTDELRELVSSRELPDDHIIMMDVQKHMDEVYDDLRHDWFYGDYRGNFDGIIPQANAKLAEYGEEYEYNEKDGVLSLSFSRDDINMAFENGYIDKPTIKEFIAWHENRIDSMAHSKHAENKRKAEARKAESTRLIAYKEEQKKARENSKREELLQEASRK